MESNPTTLDHKAISYSIPKAELHIHIEGTFEPEMVVNCALKNGVDFQYDLEQLREMFNFKNLKDFLDLYYLCCSTLRTRQDFSDLMYAYLKRAGSEGLKYAEIFFDPQTHLKNGIEFSTVLEGLSDGQQLGRDQLSVDSKLIMCFLRDTTEEEAFKVLELSKPYQKHIISIGLDSNEYGNPPEKFVHVYKTAKEMGYHLVAHTGEEEVIPMEYIDFTMNGLNAERLDHGIQIIRSEKLMNQAATEKRPLTLCPLSNRELKVYPDLSLYPLQTLRDNNLLIMLNSDDPAYFKGYIGENFYQMALLFNFNIEDYRFFARNSFMATFLEDEEKNRYLEEVENYIQLLK